MFTKIVLSCGVAAAILATVLTWEEPAAAAAPPVAVVGNAAKLEAAYDRWRAARAGGDDDVVTVGLAPSKGRSSNTRGRGEATLDLAARRATVKVSGFEPGTDLSAWFVDVGAVAVLVGELRERDGDWLLEQSLDSWIGEFELDQVVVTRAGARPDNGGLLYGFPSLFQRLYSMEFRERASSSRAMPRGLLLATVAPLAVALAARSPAPPSRVSIEQLVAEGEQIFFNETFEGNGRTCGTCHPAVNNLTIDPSYIATLDGDDPLFVAETVDALNSDLNGGLVFERPALMREFGLIVENVDGFGDLAHKFVMRGVPRIFALGLTTGPNGTRTGWSGDGVTDDAGNALPVREFTTGAVKQHFPRTPLRLPGDFIRPTPDQLNKVEAFLLSLGRQEELNTSAMAFTDPEVVAGRNFFNSSNPGSVFFGCAACHFDAGATSGLSAGNPNFDTNVEDFLVNNGGGGTSVRPTDGGFGDVFVDGAFGNGRFNTQALVEFADTLPGFHNNVTNSLDGANALDDTVEGAINFYRSTEFVSPPPDGLGLDLFPGLTEPQKDVKVAQVGKFLRVINALENEREVRERAELARRLLNRSPLDEESIDRALTIAVADVNDAIDVLKEVQLHLPAQTLFRRARGKLGAAKAGSVASRRAMIDAALRLLADARAEMIVE